MTHVLHTDDPVAEFFVGGTANGSQMANPQRYIDHGTACYQPGKAAVGIRTDVTVTGRPTDQADRSAS